MIATLIQKVPLLMKGLNLAKAFVGRTLKLIKNVTLAIYQVGQKILAKVGDVVNAAKRLTQAKFDEFLETLNERGKWLARWIRKFDQKICPLIAAVALAPAVAAPIQTAQIDTVDIIAIVLNGGAVNVEAVGESLADIIPPGGIPDELIPENTRFPSGYDKSGKYYFNQHPEYNPVTGNKWYERHKLYPNGVGFDSKGYPKFDNFSTKTIDVPGMTGERASDSKLANKLAGYDITPSGYSWHHHQNGRKMLLLPDDLHRGIGHNGGAGLIKMVRNGIIKICKN